MKMVSPSFSWPTAAPHKTSEVFPKALPSLQACVSVFLDEKADSQSIPSIWQTRFCSLTGWLGLRILIALPSASGSWVVTRLCVPRKRADFFRWRALL